MPDIEIPCVQCKEIFVFSEKDQDQYYRAQHDAAAALHALPVKKGRDAR